MNIDERLRHLRDKEQTLLLEKSRYLKSLKIRIREDGRGEVGRLQETIKEEARKLDSLEEGLKKTMVIGNIRFFTRSLIYTLERESEELYNKLLEHPPNKERDIVRRFEDSSPVRIDYHLKLVYNLIENARREADLVFGRKEKRGGVRKVYDGIVGGIGKAYNAIFGNNHAHGKDSTD